ncbi:MAG: A24 family peptidase [Chloroflexi bacterium]|nr:A24 family peptidase [Chloroflexota bacterium]
MDALLAALFGLIAGGVVNALADDLPAGRRPRLPRYPDGTPRPVRAWLGVTAFALRLRCASPSAIDKSIDGCQRQMLSWRYPLVELALMVLTILTYAVARTRLDRSGEETLIYLAWVALFVLIAVIDLEHMRIPLAPLLACVLLAFVGATAFPQALPPFASMLAGAFCAFVSFALLYLGGCAFAQFAASRQHPRPALTALGRGDVYLMTVGGLIVGFPHVLVLMALTILLGGIGAAAYMLTKSRSGGYQRFSAIPYAPFILASVYSILLLRGELSQLIFGL